MSGPALPPHLAERAEAFGRGVQQRFGLGAGARIVAGVSGGVDSVVLLRALHAAGFAVVAAHVNYGLRGAESDGDEAFVRALAAELGVPAHVRRYRLRPSAPVRNRQAQARAVRYAFFAEVAAAERARVVAVGHQQDDQAETVLLHLTRGTGLRGLAGMAPSRALAPGSDVRLIRPLLDTPREEIVRGWARPMGWPWREDASNDALHYRRNRIRRLVLPALAGSGASDVAAIARTAANVRQHLEADAPHLLRRALEAVAGRALPVAALRALPPGVRHALYLDALAAWFPSASRRPEAAAELDTLLDAQTGRRVEWPGVVVWRDRDALAFARAAADERLPQDGWAVRPGAPAETPLGALSVELLRRAPPLRSAAGSYVEAADADALGGPLVLRPWRAGDAFRPLGMDGTKKVSDLLTERGVPPSERARQLVLTAGERIVWVVGHRLAHEARVTPATRRAARLAWAPAVERPGPGR